MFSALFLGSCLSVWAVRSTSRCPSYSGNTGGVKYIRENVAGSYWWGMNWLGELRRKGQAA